MISQVYKSNSSMQKFFQYEGGALATFLGVSLLEINMILETGLLILGITSASLALREVIIKKRNNKNKEL